MSRPLIYVAGPYTFPDPIENTRKAVEAGNRLWEAGLAVVVPHLSIAWHMMSPKSYDVWLAIDMELLARCDALLRLPGQSAGADLEVAFADGHQIPVYMSEREIVREMVVPA